MTKVWIVMMKNFQDFAVINGVFGTEDAAKERERTLEIQNVHCWIDEFEIGE